MTHTQGLGIRLPLAVWQDLRNAARAHGQQPAQMATTLITGSLAMGRRIEPAKASQIVAQAAAALLAGDTSAAHQLVDAVDPRQLLAYALQTINALGLAAHDGDTKAWTAELDQLPARMTP